MPNTPMTSQSAVPPGFLRDPQTGIPYDPYLRADRQSIEFYRNLRLKDEAAREQAASQPQEQPAKAQQSQWTPEQLARWTPEQLEKGQRYMELLLQARDAHLEKKLKSLFQGKTAPSEPGTKSES